MDRRCLLKRAAGTGLCAAGVAAAGYFLYDGQGPLRSRKSISIERLGHFGVSHGPGDTISVVENPDRRVALEKALELLGGIDRFVRPGETVVIKPNVAFASPPAIGATTNPALVAGIAELCLRRAGARRVIVTDNPINDPASCFMLSGIGKAASSANARVAMPGSSLFRQITLSGAKLIVNWPVMYGPFEKADKVIGIAPVKNHTRSLASMTMKNWYGLLGGTRSVFHRDINTIIAELAVMVQPTLVILDATEVMVTNGPTGGSISDLRRFNTLIASCDQVAADAFGCRFLDLLPKQLPYIAAAEAAGAGSADLEYLKPIFA